MSEDLRVLAEEGRHQGILCGYNFLQGFLVFGQAPDQLQDGWNVTGFCGTYWHENPL
jgi:hypothetical protein